MKIAIDGYEANVPQRLGSSQVAFELLKYLSKIDKKNEYTIFLPEKKLDDLPEETFNWKYKILRPKRLWTRISLPITLYFPRNQYDLIFSPTHYIPRFSPIKRIATIFDLSFLHFPQTFPKKDLWQLTNWTKFSAQNADHIITISDFSKQDIIAKYNIPKNKITVAYPGYNNERNKPQLKQIERIRKKYNTGSNNYIIYIGTIQPRKNIIRLMEAFSQIKGDLKLVLAGKSKGLGKEGWMYNEILETPNKLRIENKVILTGFIPAEELDLLLAGAIAFVQPSLWEGFGMPVLDAMARGVPVIVSNNSCLPEIVGQAGLLVDPYSVNQIEQAIRTITSDGKLREKYSKLGILRAKNFSWEKMTKKVLKVFENI